MAEIERDTASSDVWKERISDRHQRWKHANKAVNAALRQLSAAKEELITKQSEVRIECPPHLLGIARSFGVSNYRSITT